MEPENSIFFLLGAERAITHRWMRLAELITYSAICFWLCSMDFELQPIENSKDEKIIEKSIFDCLQLRN